MSGRGPGQEVYGCQNKNYKNKEKQTITTAGTRHVRCAQEHNMCPRGQEGFGEGTPEEWEAGLKGANRPRDESGQIPHLTGLPEAKAASQDSPLSVEHQAAFSWLEQGVSASPWGRE